MSQIFNSRDPIDARYQLYNIRLYIHLWLNSCMRTAHNTYRYLVPDYVKAVGY